MIIIKYQKYKNIVSESIRILALLDPISCNKRLLFWYGLLRESNPDFDQMALDEIESILMDNSISCNKKLPILGDIVFNPKCS